MNSPDHRDRVAPSQPRLFQRLRWQILRNSGLQLLGNSRVRLVSMILSCLLIWSLLFYGAYEGFKILADSKIFFAGGIIGLVFDAMFFTLGGMLVFSTGLILYASLFTGAETRFLLTTPARVDHIFAMKFQGAIFFSSWAFMILSTPILVAYGIIFDVPWHFYALLPVYFSGYTLLPGTLGATICLLVVNFFPRQRKHALILLVLATLIVTGYWAYHALVIATRATHGNRDALQSLFNMFTLANSKFSPSQWLSRGLLASARGDFERSLFPLALIWSNGLFLYVVGTYLAKKLYRRGYNRLSDGGGSRKQYRGNWLDRVMDRLVGYLSPSTRLLIVKDFRTFRREPAQVGQLGIFAGLMLLGVFNIRQFVGTEIPIVNQTVVSMLNLFATGLLMCAYLARFVYPLISLEGRKFWILGLLPLKREQLLWGKFAFAVTMSSGFSVVMVTVSDLFLAMPVSAIGIHLLAVLALSIGLSGLCVGMSAWMPNFRETDPSKIVVGFGGTMFTIASLFYLVVAAGLMVVPYHAIMMSEAFAKSGAMPSWIFLGIPLGIAAAFLAVWFPMRIGIRTLSKMEF